MKIQTLAVYIGLALVGSTLTLNAALVSQYGILDLTANGGINPNTGVAWQAGDQYRLAFYTDGGITAQSNSTSVYDTFATTQARLSGLGDGSIMTSTGWTAMVYVNTDFNQPQGDALSDPFVRAGITDITGGSGIGGAGVAVFAMNGTTSIARNNADIANGWSNPFDSDTTIRLASGSTNQDSLGNDVVASQNVNYSPFLDQYGLGDTANIHGETVWTGGNPGGHVNALGDTIDSLDSGNGSSNANTSGRVWTRFTAGNTSALSVYSLSGLLTVTEAIPEPSSAVLFGFGGLALILRRRR